ncbi:MAG: lipoprotein-releasing ABC transporter permease subunit [Proteobacteria bacterium]|nr:lipoprotein-releasing ABC transporter permease subunit [Pseudomonadota bacterium]
MFSSLEFFLAFRYLKAKRSEGFISVIAIFSFLGITIGVATLIIVMSVMNGFRFELVQRILGINSHLSITGDHHIENYSEVIENLTKNIKQISHLNPIVESQAMLIANQQNQGVLIKGINTTDLSYKELIKNNIIAGDINNISNKNQVIIGSTLAQNLNLAVGDSLKLVSAETNSTIIGTIPRIKTYQVGAIFNSGLFEYDSGTVFTNFAMAQIHFKVPNSATSIEVFTNNLDDIENIKINIKKLLAKTNPNLMVSDWQDANASFIEALKIESVVMFLILTLIILVAVFNLISSMIMLVNDKKKNIALLRTIGFSKKNILNIFVICGSTIGFLGTFFGVLLGVIFSANINNIKLWLESITNSNLFNPAIYFLSNLPSKIFVSDVVIITSMSLVLSFLATLYPAYKASKSQPAEILRYE